jgi:eukaryotic-like serine/threonine-protein kinase
MGVVYEGRDPNLDRRVAIKTVKVENLSEEAAAEYEHRFRTEARSAARLQHPNIVSVYDSDRDGDVAFLVMEYIQGDDLKHHLDRGTRYSLEQSLKIIRDLLSALDYAHKQGIVHRDIKPANLLLEPGGRVKLTDFGVARIQDSGEATRTQGSMVGTLKYMAPEQVQGQKIDSRADLFSVGVVLYQLLTDKRPFDGDNDFSIIHQIIGHHPPAPSSVNPRLPAALDAVVARALAKTREERFATARDFAVALQAAIRRAEDQTVVPPLNPNKRLENASRPLTSPGSVPGSVPGLGSVPTSPSSVTQELELVYWKDVKDSADAEDLQVFLEKFPSGIYADLARRRLRKLGGESTAIGGSQPGTSSSVFAATQFPPTHAPDDEATRLRTDTSRPIAAGEASALRPAKWVQEEYTRLPLPPTASQSGSGASATGTDFAATQPLSVVSSGQAPVPPAPVAAASRGPTPAPAVRTVRVEDDDDSVPPAPARKKQLPMAALAGIGVLVVAGMLALLLVRGNKEQAVQSAGAPGEAVVAAPASDPPQATPPAPADAPAASAVTAVAPAAAPTPGPVASAKAPHVTAPAHKKAEPSPAKAQAKAPVAIPSPEPPRPVAAAPAPARVESEPVRPVPPPIAGTNANYQAVEQCRDKIFLSKELCLAEYCDKAGARSHPLCVKRREEARLREESKSGQAR